MGPEEMLENAFEEEEARLPKWKKSIVKWFKEYEDYIKANKLSKSTRKIKIASVKAFFHYYEMDTPKIRDRNSSLVDHPNKRDGLTKADIRKMLDGCKTLKMKAIILTGVSSGLSSADIANLKVKDFRKGIKKVYDRSTKRELTICRLSFFRFGREKTKVLFTTFISEEAVKAIEEYLKLERENPKDNEALFCRTRKDKNHMTAAGIQVSYMRLNGYIGWKNKKGKFRKGTSHMIRKYFNTQMIIAGMPEEIREHLMAHKLRDKVKDAYFLENPDELMQVYIKYVDRVTIGPVKAPVELPEYLKMKDKLEENANKIEELQEELKGMEEFKEIVAKLMEDNEFMQDYQKDVISN
ncbi:MAG: tyrosine-type recombinase/integrase [Methanobacterium sp.]